MAMKPPYSYRDDPNVPEFDDHVPVAVMDGECALCSWGARMIHRFDRSGKTRICPIQSPLGTALLRHYGLEPTDPTTWLFIDRGVAHADLEAVIYMGGSFGGLARATTLLRLFPKPVRRWVYLRIARNRYAIFGRADLCRLPNPALQKRIIG